ncbi:MAG TPA: hypothetical protein VFC19_38365 [Candidatus Limnocylindrales bacterium]|nr:hypothetical protein [Candidatus Limnocylindrales bacterium]
MTTLREQRATLARGRRLMRIAGRVLGVTGALMLVGLAALAIALWCDCWLDDSDATPAVIALIPLTAGLVTFFVLSLTARRMIGRSIKDVAANPEEEVPETLRVGPARPWSGAWTWVSLLGLGLVALPFLATVITDLARWVCPGLMVVTGCRRVGAGGRSTRCGASAAWSSSRIGRTR